MIKLMRLLLQFILATGGLIAVFFQVLCGIFLVLCGLFVAYQFYGYWSQPASPLNLAIGSDHSPDENMDLIKRECGQKIEFCHCFLKKTYSETSRAERILYLHWDDFMLRRGIRLGARPLGLSDNDLQRMLETARRKIASIKASCSQ